MVERWARAMAFRMRFYVELLGEGEDPERTIIADFTEADFPNPGLLPVVIDAKGGLAQKVRITATRLIGSKERFFCALGEVMLLQGNHNLGARLEAIGPGRCVRAAARARARIGAASISWMVTPCSGPPLGTRSSPRSAFAANR
jgi:hypothetical protein